MQHTISTPTLSTNTTMHSMHSIPLAHNMTRFTSMTDEGVRGRGAAPGSELADVHQEIQQLKAAVEVLTNATHLMAIPNAISTLPAETGKSNPTSMSGPCRAGLGCLATSQWTHTSFTLHKTIVFVLTVSPVETANTKVGRRCNVSSYLCCAGNQNLQCTSAGRRATGEARIGEVVHGGISTTTPAVASAATAVGGSVPGAGAILNGSQSAATAVRGSLPALPAAATAAAAAIAGLRAPLDGSASKSSAFHPLAGSKQKQVGHAHVCQDCCCLRSPMKLKQQLSYSTPTIWQLIDHYINSGCWHLLPVMFCAGLGVLGCSLGCSVLIHIH